MKPPKVEAKEANYLDDEQAELLIKTVKEKAEHPFDMIIMLLLHTGMRRGECCGLDWNDIDFENCTIDINKSLLYLSDRGVFESSTKTYSSKRVIKVSSDLINKLEEYRRWQDREAVKLGDKWINSGKVFTAWNGKPINPGTVTSWFHYFVQDNNLPYISIHGLRHQNTMKTHLLNCTIINYISLHKTAAVQKMNCRCYCYIKCIVVCSFPCQTKFVLY